MCFSRTFSWWERSARKINKQNTKKMLGIDLLGKSAEKGLGPLGMCSCRVYRLVLLLTLEDTIENSTGSSSVSLWALTELRGESSVTSSHPRTYHLCATNPLSFPNQKYPQYCWGGYMMVS